MSNSVNTILIERAGEMIGEWEGTDMELDIRKAIADNDLDRLELLVSEAEAETAIQEFNRYDIY